MKEEMTDRTEVVEPISEEPWREVPISSIKQEHPFVQARLPYVMEVFRRSRHIPLKELAESIGVSYETYREFEESTEHSTFHYSTETYRKVLAWLLGNF
jgi:hypothetical protein